MRMKEKLQHLKLSDAGAELPRRILCSEIPTPCYVIDEGKLRENGRILKEIEDATGCKILLAQKAFSNYDLYPVLEEYLAGTEASGLYEARLGREKMPAKECHVFSAAYVPEQFDELLEYADHIVFNSPSQLRMFGPAAKKAGKEVGLRINPLCQTQEGHEIYDPCAPGGRLGTTKQAWDEQMNDELIGLLDGLHFHTLCEQNSDALEITLRAVEEQFGEAMHKMRWINMGGGHHITRADYDRELLKKLICHVRDTYGAAVYLEPGEAVALNAGYLCTRVLDFVKNGDVVNAILDMSAACHTPDVLEMPYRPPLFEGFEAGEKPYTYRLGGPTCLSGDIIGDYAFERPLEAGQRLLFEDMAIYTTCKNNTFNGMPLPDIWVVKGDEIVRLTDFTYEDFKGRLGTKDPT